MRKKVLWIITMAFLSLALVTIILSRQESSTNIIFGGAESGFISADSLNYSDNTPAETPEPTVDIWPQLTTQDFEDHVYLQLVNGENLLSSIWEPEQGLEKISGTRYMMYSAEYVSYLNDFLDAIREAGFDPYVAGAYRTYSYQKHLYDSKASQIAYEKAGGHDVPYTDPLYQEAAKEAESIVMVPGSSEHQLGLAVDLLDKQRSRMVYEDMDQEFFAFLDAHCAEYGFIKRYPTRKLLLTGWDEPWHYRYVGREAATFIMEQGICFEEFYAHYHPDFTY